MKTVIVRNIDRPESNLARKLGEYGVATVHEAQGRSGLMLPYLRPVFSTARIAAPAITALCHAGDNLMIHAAIEVCQPGDVMVVATKSPSSDGMFGELLATSFQARGICGLIIDAGVRDVAELSAMKFPVFSKAISAQGTVKESAGAVNIPIVCAGAVVRPGDVIVADQDGVVVVPRRAAADVAKACEERLAKEAKNRVRLRNGELGLDIYGLRGKLQSLGVTYTDRLEE